jgi:hypothetical protein
MGVVGSPPRSPFLHILAQPQAQVSASLPCPTSSRPRRVPRDSAWPCSKDRRPLGRPVRGGQARSAPRFPIKDLSTPSLHANLPTASMRNVSAT